MTVSSSNMGPDDIIRLYEVINLLRGMWVPDIAQVLSQGPRRFDDLRRAINQPPYPDRWWFHRTSQGLSGSQLSRTLAAMQRDLLVRRHENRRQMPIAVTYELSPLLLGFLNGPAAAAVVAWLHDHDDELEVVRRRHRNALAHRDGHHDQDRP